MKPGLRTGERAAAAAVNVQTLRYYERRGLLQEPARTPGGHRLYAPDSVTVLRVIKAAQRLGFILTEITELIKAGRRRHTARDGGPDDGLRGRATAKLAHVAAKIADLMVIRASLLAAVEAGCDDLAVCAGTAGCPIPFADLALTRPTDLAIQPALQG